MRPDCTRGFGPVGTNGPAPIHDLPALLRDRAKGSGGDKLLEEAAAALEAAREDAEAARTAITTAPKCRLLEVQSLGFDDPDRPVLEWMIKSGKRFRIVDDAAIDQARGKGVQDAAVGGRRRPGMPQAACAPR